MPLLAEAHPDVSCVLFWLTACNNVDYRRKGDCVITTGAQRASASAERESPGLGASSEGETVMYSHGET